MPKLQSSRFTKLWTWLPTVIITVGFLIIFRGEVKLLWQLIVAYFLVRVLHMNLTLPVNPETVNAGVVIAVNLIVFGFVYLLVLLWISQFTLPVRSRSERWMAFSRLFLYTLAKSLHGPAIFVKEGKPVTEEGELNDLQGGVAFVDLNSAIVVEQQFGSSTATKQEVRFDSLPNESAEHNSPQPGVWLKIFNLLRSASGKAKAPIVKTFGPGIVFTESGEKIIGWADLRKHSRTREEVVGSTRDGIEVKTKISVAFTLGQPEDTLQVAKVGDSWLVIQTSPASAEDLGGNSNLQHGDLVIKLLSDSLRPEDSEELHYIFGKGDFKWVEMGSPGAEQKRGTVSQFVFDSERVFAAVYSRARHAKDGMLGEWTELPAYVAAEAFRNLLAHENYDDLYLPDDPEKFPLSDFKSQFGRIVRNMGILGYQIVMRKDGTPLKSGQAWNVDELIFSEATRFQSAAILRDRGIKVLSVGFSDLVPANEIVRAQLFENWRAHWQQETQKTLADHELRTIRIHNHERSRTQQDMIYSLSRIFQDGRYTEEALAIRLYQALEVAAINPTTQRLLPSDTVQMLSNLRQWLLPDEKKIRGRNDSSSDVMSAGKTQELNVDED